jgi:hypothetical protein
MVVDLDTITKINAANAKLEMCRANHTKYMDSLTLAESAVELFSNDTLWASLINANDTIFYTVVTELMGIMLPQYTVEKTNSFEIRLSGIGISTLSESELYKITIALQTAFSVSSGVGILFLDGIDIISNNTIIKQILDKIKTYEQLDTIIVTSAREIE